MAEPIANNDSFSLDVGKKGLLGFVMNFWGMKFDTGLLANDTDADGDELQIIDVSGTAMESGGVTVAGDTGGLFTIQADGTISYDTTVGFEDLAQGETRVTSVTYTVMDSEGNTSLATVEFTVTGINAIPVAGDDSVGSFSEDAWYSIIYGADLLANDSDAETAIQNIEFVSIDTTLTKGHISLATAYGVPNIFLNPQGGGLAYSANGQFDYLDAGETAIDTFTYTIRDEYGATATATVEITVYGGEDRVYAVLDQVQVNENPDVSGLPVIAPLANDYDVDASDTLSVASVDTSSLKGILVDNGDGTFQYDTDGQFEYLAEGETELTSFDYVVQSSDGSTDSSSVEITVVGQNDAPVASSDTVGTVSDTGFMSFDISALLANDYDVDNGSSFSLVSIDSSSTQGQIVDHLDGTFTYNPNGAFDHLGDTETGLDTFTYIIEDELGAQSVGVAEITISGLSYSLSSTVTDDVQGVATLSGALRQDDLLANDFGDEPGADAVIAEFDLRGSQLDSFRTDINSLKMTTLINETPAEFMAQTSYSYTAMSSNGSVGSATVNLEGQGNLDYWDRDDVGLIWVTIPETESYVYDPNALFDGSAGSYYSYNGDVSQMPHHYPSSLYASTINNGDGTYTISPIDKVGPAGATVSQASTGIDFYYHGQQGELLHAGTGLSFISEEQGLATGDNTITAQDDIVSISENDVVMNAWNRYTLPSENVLINDIKVSPSDTLKVTEFYGVQEYYSDDVLAELVVNSAGDITVRFQDENLDALAEGEVYTKQLDFLVVDQNGNYDTSTLTLNIVGENDAPVAALNQISINENQTVIFDADFLMSNDYDPEGGALEFVSLDYSGIQGDLTENPDGSFTFDPTVAFDSLSESDSIAWQTLEYTVRDEQGLESIGELQLGVIGVDDVIV